MGTSTLVRLVFGLLTFTIMARLLASRELNPLIAALYENAQLVQVVAVETSVCSRPLGRQCFYASLHPMKAEIA